MFLTHGDLPHEALWTAWMREARGLLPRTSLAGDATFCLQQCDAAGAHTWLAGWLAGGAAVAPTMRLGPWCVAADTLSPKKRGAPGAMTSAGMAGWLSPAQLWLYDSGAAAHAHFAGWRLREQQACPWQ